MGGASASSGGYPVGDFDQMALALEEAEDTVPGVTTRDVEKEAVEEAAPPLYRWSNCPGRLYAEVPDPDVAPGGPGEGIPRLQAEGNWMSHPEELTLRNFETE